MEGGIAIFLLLLILVGAVIAFLVLGGGGAALASRKREGDVREGARQGRAARNTQTYPGEDRE